MIFSLAACGAAETNEAPVSQGTEPVADSGAEEAVNELGSPESIIPTVICDPVLTYQEDTASLTGNNGASIGTEEGCSRHSEAGGVVFEAGEGENPFMPLAKRLDDADGVEQGRKPGGILIVLPLAKGTSDSCCRQTRP